MSALSTQVGGGHYKSLPVQYVVRHRDKNGAEGIRKAIHFLRLLLEIEYGIVEPKGDDQA